MNTRWIVLLTLGALLLAGCEDKQRTEQLIQQTARLQDRADSLSRDITERDQYFDEVMKTVSQIYGSLEGAREREEELLKHAGTAEGTPVTNAEVRKNLITQIQSIGDNLKENRKRISDLQARNKSLASQFSSFKRLIESLKQNLAEREQSIAMLEARVSGLENTVAEKTRLVAERDSVIDSQTNTMNTAYYVVGTREELTEKGIITKEGGFLWGLLGATTTISPGFDRSQFKPLNKSMEKMIPVSGDIDEILPRRSETFYTMEKNGEDYSDLTITDPKNFWQDNYLVIVLN